MKREIKFKGKQMNKYFHLLTDEEFSQAVEQKKQYSDFKQPSWCSYPNALNYNLGCWKLTERKVKTIIE